MSSPNDRPDALELIEVVSDFLGEEVMGALEGQLAFHVRVAQNALRIAVRELRAESRNTEEHNARLARFDCANDRELVDAIRSGSLDDRYEELSEEFRKMVWEKVQIVNPKYPRSLPGPAPREGPIS